MSEVTFEPFQRVLVRGNDDREWGIDLFDRMMNGQHLCLTGAYYQCLPYNDETKHLLGTTDSPTPLEPEFKWGDKVEVRDYDHQEWIRAVFCYKKPFGYYCFVYPINYNHWKQCRHADW